MFSWFRNNNDNESSAPQESILDSLNPFYSSDEQDPYNLGSYFKLSYETRLYSFIGFSIVGVLFSLIGSLMIFSANLTGFAIAYSFGAICMMLATLFLFGPMKQIKNMFSTVHRTIAVITYLTAIVMTLISALLWQNGFLCLIFLVIQLIAYFWYMITSIPGGQTLCESCCQSVAGNV